MRRDSRFRSLLWSAAEGLSQRGSTAVATFVLAAITGPSTVGAIAAAVLALGVYQAAFEVPLRQAGQRLIGVAGGQRTLRRWALVAGAIGFVLLLGTIGGMSFGYLAPATALALTPFLLVPLLSAGEVTSVLRLQHAGQWHLLASARAVAGVVALLVGVAIALLTRSAFAMAVQYVLAEGIFATVVVLRARAVPAGAGVTSATPFRHDFVQTAISSLLGWTRGQADRIAIGVVSAPALLGSYSLATAMSRAPAEAVLSGGSNALRVQLAFTGEDPAELRTVVEANERRMQLLMLACVGASLGGVFFVARFLLGPKWDDAVLSVPIFAGSAFATAHALICGILLNHLGLSRRAYVTQGAEALLSIGIAAGVLVDFQLGATLFLLREVSAGLAMSWYARAWLTRRAMLLWLAPTVVVVVVVLASWATRLVH